MASTAEKAFGLGSKTRLERERKGKVQERVQRERSAGLICEQKGGIEREHR